MKETITMLRRSLRSIYPAGEAEAIIRLIFEHLKGWSPVDIVMHSDDELSPFMQGKVKAILDRLMRHEPIQYIIGEAQFYGLKLHVTPATLIPRPETEELVDLVLKFSADRPDLRVLDAGTGSGCIALALSRNMRFPQITAIDASQEALNVARDNAAALKCRIRFEHRDILTMPARPESLDIIVSNPPYIGQSESAAMDANVLDYEPHDALFVPDSDPLRFYTALARFGRVSLSTGGGLFFEINPLHADAMRSMLEAEGYTDIEIIKDMQGYQRFATAIKPEGR